MQSMIFRATKSDEHDDDLTSALLRLGSEVRKRREELGLTQDDVVERGGPSDKSQTRIERGQAPRPTATTLAKLDTALEWTRGSAAAVLAGKSPTPANVAYTAEDVERHARLAAALQKAGVTSIAARGVKRGPDGTSFTPEAIDELVKILNDLPE